MKVEKIKSYLTGWSNCSRCHLAHPRREGLVFGEGDPNSRILFIGEWPKNAQDEKSGSCMSASEKKLFHDMLEFFGTNAQDVFLCPVSSCRPVDELGATRNPEASSLKSCYARVRKMIEIIDPLVIVLIGPKAHSILGKSKEYKKTYASLTADPRPIEVILEDSISGVEIRKSAVCIRNMNWLLEKAHHSKTKGGEIHKMMNAMQMAFKILDMHNLVLYGQSPPSRQEVMR